MWSLGIQGRTSIRIAADRPLNGLTRGDRITNRRQQVPLTAQLAGFNSREMTPCVQNVITAQPSAVHTSATFTLTN